MSLRPASDHTYQEVVTSGVNDKNTVSNGPDDGANSLMAKFFLAVHETRHNRGSCQ